MTEQILRTDPVPGVAVLTLARPKARNALVQQTWTELRDLASEIAHESGVRAVVLTGGPEYFSAGGDIKTMTPTGTGVLAPVHRLAYALEAVRALHAVPQPLIAAVEGYAIGVGWSLVLACDVVTASRTSYFQAPFLERAVVPDGGFAALMRDRLGPARTMDLLLSRRRVPAEEALALGLVSRVVDPGQALPEALRQAAEVCVLPADAVRLTKRLVRSQPASLDAALQAEFVTWALAAHSPDSAEARRAFVEKRAPRFTTKAAMEQ